jgi:hypothetical protein
LVLPQSAYDFASLHEINLADRRDLSRQVRLHRVLSRQEAKQTTSQHAPSLNGQKGWMRLLSRKGLF